jgi:MULE transposase domain
LNLELYAVLAEVDGMGFPLAYMLLTTVTAIEDLARTTMITRFLSNLDDKGVKPRFVMTDKDMSQIGAVKRVWPAAGIQLCLWHVKKAVKRKLAETKKPKTVRYSMNDAKTEFPFIDLGFYPATGPETAIQSVTALVVTAQSSQQRKKAGAFTFCPPEHRDQVLELLVKHFHQHPLIPSSSDQQHHTNTSIREIAVKEMYGYCKDNDLRWTWAYLWVEWYSMQRWREWARSSKSEISVLKTTMIVESHWRLIKRDYLYTFNKPRVDLLVWVLLSRLIPRCLAKYRQVFCSRQRASWREDFKKIWRGCKNRARNDNTTYLTNTTTWTCSCPAYLLNRFLLCKHLIQSIRPVTPNFFLETKRQRSPPFWVHKDLKPLIENDEAREEDNGDEDDDKEDNDKDNDKEDNDGEDNGEDNDDDNEERYGEEDNNEDYDEEEEFSEMGDSWEEVSSRVDGLLQRWRDMLNSQREFKDVRFWLAAEDAMKHGTLEKMLMKCERLDRRRTLPKTWKDHDQQTMFYRTRS